MGILNVTPDSFSDGGFLFCTDRSMTRTGRFAADIKDVCTVSNHGFCMFQCMIHGVPFAAVGEGIRS